MGRHRPRHVRGGGPRDDPGQFDYVRPASLDEVLRILKDREGEAKLLSGGYSLLPLIKLRLAQPALLVDLRDVGGPRRHRRDRRRPDASAPGRPIARSTRPTIVRDRYPLLHDVTGDASATRRSATGARSAAPSPTPTRPPTGRRSSSRPSATIVCREPAGRARSIAGPRLLPRHVHDGDRADRGPDRDPDPAPTASRRRAPTRSSSARSATSRRSASRRSSGSTRTAASRRAGIGVTGVAETPFAATDAEAVLVGNAPIDDALPRRPEPPPGRRADRPATSAVPSNTSGRWPRR